MSNYGYCERCGEYCDLTDHQRVARPYMARFDDEDDWRDTCGEYHEYLGDRAEDEAFQSAAEAICCKYDRNHTPEMGDRTVWVRDAGDEGEGTPYSVETRAAPVYSARKMVPCSTGCGQPVAHGGKCYDCRQAEWRAEHPPKAKS